MAITMLAQNLKYGLLPADMNTGGSGLVDKSNVESARSEGIDSVQYSDYNELLKECQIRKIM